MKKCSDKVADKAWQETANAARNIRLLEEVFEKLRVPAYARMVKSLRRLKALGLRGK
jgi:uncharacterized protein (UPF0147 family)